VSTTIPTGPPAPPGHTERRQALAARFSAIEDALAELRRQLQHVDPVWATAGNRPYDLAVSAVRGLLGLVQRAGAGELHLVLDLDRGITVRVAHEDGAPTARLVLPLPGTTAAPAPVPPAPAPPAPAPPAEAPPAPAGPAVPAAARPPLTLRPEVRAELDRLRAARRNR
jgi:hypothetical protein